MTFLMLANLYMVVFYSYYWLCLRKETFFRYNRIYLTGSLVLSFILPLVQLPWVEDFFMDSNVVQVRAGFDEAWVITQPVSEIPAPVASPFPLVAVIYWTGTALAGLWFIYRLFRLRKRLNQFQGNQAYSFFRWLRIDQRQSGAMDIWRHEQVHIRRLHSLDILLTELVILFNWFNPVVYFFTRSIKLQHEYEADAWAAACADDKAEYAELLVSHAFQVPLYTLTNNFYNRSFIKNRIVMLFKEKSKQRSLLKYAFAVPLFLLMIIFSSAGMSDLKPASILLQAGDTRDFLKQLSNNIRYPRVAVDAGKEGVVGVAFVKKSGELESIDIIGRNGVGMEKEVDRVVRLPRTTEKLPDGAYFFHVKFGIDKSPSGLTGDISEEYKNYTYLDAILITAFTSVKKQKGEMPELNKDSPESIRKIIPKSQEVFQDTVQKPENLTEAAIRQPEYPGGIAAFIQFVAANYRFPQDAINHGVSGTIHLQFIVETNGSLSNISCLQDLGYGTGEEAIRVAKISKDWNPGLHNGKSVRVSYTLPIRLRIDKSKKEES